MSAPPKILVVDDMPSNAEMVEALLASEGFRAMSVNDGSTAFTACRSEQPDLVLLDVMMPGRSGFETCAQLKQDPATADIPIIFLSSLDDVKSKVAGLKIGGVDYISKPVHGEELLARVRVHLQLRDRNRVLAAASESKLRQMRDAQSAILVRPVDFPEAGFDVYYGSLEETGGDFYDVANVGGDAFAYFVADVSGHGIGAAFLTSALKALLLQYSGPVYSPEDVLRGVDSVMRHVLGEEQYLTACYARLTRSARRLTVVSAGHPPAVLVRASGRAEMLEMDTEPLGVFGSAVLQRRDLPVAPGDRLYMYTDGLIETAPGRGREEGLRRLVQECVQRRAEPLEGSARNIAGALRQTALDDALLLVVETCL